MFIELTKKDDRKILININHIIDVCALADGNTIIDQIGDENSHRTVKESYEQVKDKIAESSKQHVIVDNIPL